MCALVSTHNIFFVEKFEKYYPFDLELCITKKTHFELAKTGLSSGVVGRPVKE